MIRIFRNLPVNEKNAFKKCLEKHITDKIRFHCFFVCFQSINLKLDDA